MYYAIAPFLIALPLLAGCASIEPVVFTDEHPASAAPTTPAQSQADSVLATAPFRSPAHPLHGEGRATASIAAVHSSAATMDSTPAAVEYTCPMHPEIVQAHEGRCPACDMRLVPKKADPVSPAGSQTSHAHAMPTAPSSETATTSAAPVRYTCPMHPKVVEDHEGRCPICEMKLVPQKLGSEMAPGEAAP